jgi:hypothetical protein
MTLSMGSHIADVSSQVTVLVGARPDSDTSSAKRPTNPRAYRAAGRIADLERRIIILKRLIAYCDHMASELDLEIKNEEHRLKVYDPADITYSTYATATAFRRDNLRRSAAELNAHLTNADQQLGELSGMFAP